MKTGSAHKGQARIGIYAMGGGYGHIMRACALARSLLKKRPELILRLYLPRRGYECAQRLGLSATCPPFETKESTSQLVSWVKQQIGEDHLDLLLVDCFPQGFHQELSGVLPTIPKKAFLTRWLDPSSQEHSDQGALESYDVLVTTERLHSQFDSLGFQRVEPILAVSAPEILSRREARSALALEKDKKVVFLLGTHRDTEFLYLKEILSRLAVRNDFELMTHFPKTRLWEKTFPVARFLRAADLVVTPPGNNTYYEIVQAGVPAIFTPRRLPNDNHNGRASGQLGFSSRVSSVSTPYEISSLFPQALQRPLQPRRPFYGGSQAATLILEVLENPSHLKAPIQSSTQSSKGKNHEQKFSSN